MTEQPDPIPVHLTGSDVPLGQAAPRRKRRSFVTRTFTLNATDPAQELLPQSDSRAEAWITYSTNVVLLGASRADVLAAGGQCAQLPVADAVPFPVNTTDALWAGAATLPTTISVFAVYEQPE